MEEVPYTNREMDEKFRGMQDITEAQHEAVMTGIREIKARQDIANGRLSKGEFRQAIAIGGIAVLTAILLPTMGWLAINSLATSTKVAALAAVVHTLTNK